MRVVKDIETQFRELETKFNHLYLENEVIKEKLDIAVKALRVARDTAYSSTQDCPKCGFIDKKLTKAIEKIKEIK